MPRLFSAGVWLFDGEAVMIKRRDGYQFVCEAPERAVKLETKRGRVVATLESGMKFILPLFIQNPDDIPPEGT